MQTVIAGRLTSYEVVNPQAKDTILILHGWGQSSFSWLNSTTLFNRNHRYLLLDLPSFGGTANLADGADIPQFTEFVHEFTKKLNLNHFVLIGHSFGGQIAADFALKHPDLLQKLVLVDAAVIRTKNLKTQIKSILAKTFKPISSLLPIQVINSIFKIQSPDYINASKHQRSVLHKILRYNLKSKLHLIEVPTDIIWGSEDHLIPYVGKVLVETIPNARLHLVYGAGHSLQLSHPDKLATTINEILNS